MTLGEPKQQIDALLADRPALALSTVEHYRARVTRRSVHREVIGVSVHTPWGGRPAVVVVEAGGEVFS